MTHTIWLPLQDYLVTWCWRATVAPLNSRPVRASTVEAAIRRYGEFRKKDLAIVEVRLRSPQAQPA